jgi:hypothetical protein
LSTLANNRRAISVSGVAVMAFLESKAVGVRSMLSVGVRRVLRLSSRYAARVRSNE